MTRGAAATGRAEAADMRERIAAQEAEMQEKRRLFDALQRAELEESLANEADERRRAPALKRIEMRVEGERPKTDEDGDTATESPN